MQVKGNAEALEQLYREQYRNYRDIMAGVVGSHDLAREVVQEAFARALREQRKFRGEGSLEAWVWRITVNVALKARRDLRREWQLDEEYEAPARETAPDRDVRAAVRALPPRRRLFVFLRYFADLSYAEIAEVAGVSEGTVAATLAQAKEELLGLLDGEEVGR
ncbi:MAG: RNA polymerase sigma factor [Gaiellaceae bacterium]